MPYRKNAKNHNSPTNMPRNLSSGLPTGTRVSISLEPSGPPDPFGDELVGGILAGRATLILETSPAEEAGEEESLLTSQVIESKLKELAHANAKTSTVRTYTKCWSRFAEVFEELPSDRDSIMDYLALSMAQAAGTVLTTRTTSTSFINTRVLRAGSLQTPWRE